MTGIKIDLKDRKILAELSLNARAHVARIAKKVGLSKQVVKYRLENMEKNELIEGYYAVLNINKLGYLYHRLFFKFRNVSQEKENELIQFCKANKRIGWIFQLCGNWDFAVAIWARDTIEFEEALYEIMNRFGECFEDKCISVSTTIHHLKHKFLLDQGDATELVMGDKIEEPKLDELDYRLIGILAKDARKSLLEIGAELKTSSDTVKYRMNNLMKQGILLGFNVKLNYKLLGYIHQKVFLNLVNISEDNMQRLTSYLKSMNNTIYVTKAVGVADAEFELLVKSNEEFYETMRGLRYNFSDLIKSYSSFIIYNEPYINYLPMRK